MSTWVRTDQGRLPASSWSPRIFLEDLPWLQGETSAQTLARGSVSLALTEAPSGQRPGQQGLPLQRPLEPWAPSYH